MGIMKLFKSYMYHDSHKFTKTMRSAVTGASLVYKKARQQRIKVCYLYRIGIQAQGQECAFFVGHHL